MIKWQIVTFIMLKKIFPDRRVKTCPRECDSILFLANQKTSTDLDSNTAFSRRLSAHALGSFVIADVKWSAAGCAANRFSGLVTNINKMSFGALLCEAIF